MKIITPLLLLPLILLAFPVAYAAKPSSGTGTFSATDGTPQVRSAGGNMIITHSVMFTISGASSGTCSGQDRDVIHPDGTITFQGMCTFTGMIGDKSGTTVDRYSGTGSVTSFEGHFIVGQGTAGLEGVHGQGTFESMATGPFTSTGTYTLLWHFGSK